MKLKQLFAVCLLGTATVATANVSMEMFQMNRQVGGLINATSAEDFQESAEAFIEAATQAQAKMPRSLDDDKIRFNAYQKAMQDLIDTAKHSNELAGQGKLDEARELAKKLNQLKQEGHAEFKR